MFLNQGQAKYICRLCKIISITCLLSILILFLTEKSIKPTPSIAGFIKKNAHIDPISYKYFYQLLSQNNNPFMFQDSSLTEHSFLIEEVEELEPEPEPEPELDISNLVLMGIIVKNGIRYAVIRDSNESSINKVKKGESINGAEVFKILQDKIILRQGTQEAELTWNSPWQKIQIDESDEN